MPFKDKIIGIYKITNKINNKCYIGSAISIKNRLVQHKSLLNKNKHFNAHLQSAWNKYGFNNFTFEILEVTNKEELQEKEEYYIQFFKSNDRKIGYNIRINCNTNLNLKASKQTIEKLRNSHLGHKRSKEAQDKISKSQFKPVSQLDLDGNLIASFDSIKQASDITNIPSRSISACCTGTLNKSYGYKWKHN